MKRNNKGGAVYAATLSVELSELMRVFISWLISQQEGLGKEDARKVARLVEVLDLENPNEVPAAERDHTKPYELSGYEIRYLVDTLDHAYDKKKVPPAYARVSINLYDTLKEALDGAAEQE